MHARTALTQSKDASTSHRASSDPNSGQIMRWSAGSRCDALPELLSAFSISWTHLSAPPLPSKLQLRLSWNCMLGCNFPVLSASWRSEKLLTGWAVSAGFPGCPCSPIKGRCCCNASIMCMPSQAGALSLLHLILSVDLAAARCSLVFATNCSPSF